MSIVRNPEKFWEGIAIKAIVAGIFGIAFLNCQSEQSKNDSLHDVPKTSQEIDVFSDEAKDVGYAPGFTDHNTKVLGRVIINLNIDAAERDADPANCLTHLDNAIKASQIAGVAMPRLVDC